MQSLEKMSKYVRNMYEKNYKNNNFQKMCTFEFLNSGFFVVKLL